jgi:hypothetical protein
VIPAYIVSVTTRPEKVALMDGAESLLISPLVPVEESTELLETISLWAAKSFLDRGPQGFDAPETLHRLFLPEAAKKAEAEFNALADEFSKKSIHQNGSHICDIRSFTSDTYRMPKGPKAAP